MIVSHLQDFYNNLKRDSPIIAIDYGLRKTGIAISNHTMTFAMPFKQLNLADDNKQISEIIKLIHINKVCGIVIGLPIDMRSNETEQTQIVRKFAVKIDTYLDLPIYLQDERFTSQMADNLLKISGLKRKERNAKDDAIAASIILQDTLDSMKKL